MLSETKIFLSGIISVLMLLFVAEIGNFSQCTPMNVDKSLLSSEELFVYAFFECGKSPVIKFALAGNSLFVLSYSAFTYYVLKWASVPSVVWCFIAIPFLVATILVIYYHHLILKHFGHLEGVSTDHYIEMIMIYSVREKFFTILMGLIMLISFIYKKRKSKAKPKSE